MRIVICLSCGLIYLKGKDLGVTLLFQCVGYRVLLRSRQHHELRSVDALLQTG